MSTISGPGNVAVNINQSHQPSVGAAVPVDSSQAPVEAGSAGQGATLQGRSVVFESAKRSPFQDLIGSGAPSLTVGSSTGPGTMTVGDLISRPRADLPGSAEMAPGAGMSAGGGEGHSEIRDAGQSKDDLKDKMGNLGDLTSERQLELQQLMEKKTQIEQTLSNVLKGFENTQRDLVANLK